MNIWTITGNLGKDPEVRYSEKGNCICTLSVGVRWYQGKDKPEKTDWIRVKIFGKRGEYAGNNLHKGKRVTVSGAGHVEEWDDNGVKKRATVLYADEIDFETGRKDNSTGSGGADFGSFGKDVFPEEEIPF